jgi:hypothetical protein
MIFKFNWSPKYNEAFEQLKTLLTTAPILAQPHLMYTVMRQALVSDVF